MKKKKLMMAVVSASLVGVVAIGGTLAYLSDKSNTVTNTFNVGKGYVDDNKHVGLWLDETKKTGDENPTEIDLVNRTEEGVQYDEMLPGSVVAKDPTFHLTKESTNSYVFAEVKGLDALVKAGFVVSDTDLKDVPEPASNLSDSWQKVADFGDDQDAGLDGLYIYGIKDSWAEGGIQPMTPGGGEDGYTYDAMFNYVKYSSTVENGQHNQNLNGLDKVTVRGVAVQEANLTWQQAQVEAEKVLAGPTATPEP